MKKISNSFKRIFSSRKSVASFNRAKQTALHQRARSANSSSKTNILNLKKLSWTQYLRLSVRFAKLSYKAFVKKHRLLSRIIAATLAIILLFSIYYEVQKGWDQIKPPEINSAVEELIGRRIDQYAQKLVEDKQGGYTFNKDYIVASGLDQQSSGPKVTATFASGDTGTVSVSDPVNNVTISLTPKFAVKNPKKQSNRIVYQLAGKNVTAIYSAKGSGIKEDIIINKFQADKMSFSYELGLPSGTQARIENDGSLGVYGVIAELLGNVTTSTDADAQLLQKARDNAEKKTLLFRIPAPVVFEGKKKLSRNAKAQFILEGNLLSVEANDLKSANYPLSIDPSIYVESAAKLMRGNNETNTDFDVDNELIQKSQTSGARIDAWSSTINLSSAVWQQGTAVAGGYIYSAGGVGSASTVTTTYNTAGATTFAVPTGVTSVTVKAWGAGGGGGGGDGGSGLGGAGGGGGYAKAVITTTPGESLDVLVGTAGAKATGNSRAGNGGGYSAVKRSGTFLVQAGGGGGGGGTRGSRAGGAGGAGGGASGIAGATGGGTGGGTSGGGGGAGTNAAGGAGGTAGTSGAAGRAGVANAGGNGSASVTSCATSTAGSGGAGGTGAGGSGGIYTTSSCSNGGGGGGGRFGGGGGGTTTSNNRGGGGGGGGSDLVTGSSTVETAGSGTTPGNSADSDRGGLGDGGSGATTAASASAGDSGIVLISYTTAGTTTATVSWAKFNTSTNAIESPNPGAGACTGWCTNSVYDLPAARQGLSLVAYNGFLYAIGGSNSSAAPQTSVYIAKIGANGEPQLWHPTGGTPAYWYTDTALGNARSYFGAVAYNNRMYLMGGLTTSSTLLSSNTVIYADIKPMGTFTSWTSTGMSALSTNRYGLSAQVYNDVIYIMGGNNTFTGTPVTTVEYVKLKTDGTMNAWVATNSLTTSGRQTMGGSFSMIASGYVYVGGGCTAVNGSGYCTAIATDVQLASINSDGSLAAWNTIIGLDNTRIGHTLIAWQGGLYRLGGCRAQDASGGGCTDTVLDVDYGVINPDGEASTVATSTDNGTAPCSTVPQDCNLPSSSVGNMLNASVIMNGYLYIMGGCTSDDCSSYSAGITYQSIASDGSLQRPAACGGTYTDSYCISSTTLPNALGAPGVAVFNKRIYLVGGFPTIANISFVTVNDDGSFGAWTNTDFTTIAVNGIDDDLSYPFVYARANPASAGSIPGNLFIFGGCTGTTSSIGCSSYSDSVYKCDLNTAGVPSNCTITGQVQIGTVTGASGTGLGAHAGAVYANYIYLMGGLAPGITDLTTVRYAKFDDNNNVVTAGSGWVEGSNQLTTGRRRGTGFGYNGYLYIMGGYDGADAIADIEFAKLNVSDGSWGAFATSSVTIQKRWALSSVVSNSYAYVIGGCTAGPAPTGCTTRTNTIQTFQIYNNNSGTPVSYGASANQFGTDRFGSSSAIVNGYIYVAGGCTSSADCTTASDSVQYALLDAYGNVGSWNAGGNLPAVRTWGQLEVAGGTLYYIGGQTSTSTDERPEIYWATPSGGAVTWATVGSSYDLPDGRTKLSAASWNNRIYVTGGIAETGGAVSNAVYVSPDLSAGGDITSAWTSLTTFDVPRSGHTTIAYANNLYVLGGYDGTNYLNDVQFTQINSDGTVDAWTFTTSMPSALSQADGFAANGYMYIVGGRNSNTNCPSNTLVAPVSANTTIATGNNPTGVGEWFETNVRYEGRRYGGSVAYSAGKYYVSGGVCDGFPSVTNLLAQTFSSNTTSHSVTMPSTVNAGDLLLVLFTNDGSATVTDPDAGGAWTSISTLASGANVRGSVWGKLATGTEDSTGVDFVTSATEEASAQVYRIKSGEWSGAIAGVEAASVDAGTTTTPDPPSLNPGTWGTENTLWLSYAAGSSYTAVTTYPANYNGGTHTISNTGTAGSSASSAWIESAAASEDPGSFTMSTSSTGVAFTIGVRPASFSFTGSNRIVQTAVYAQPQVAIYSKMIDTDTDVFPNSFLMNGLDNSIGARWQAKYRSMHDPSDGLTNPNEDCGTSSSMAAMTTWGYETNYGNVTLGDVAPYTAKESGGGNINCARFFYFYVSIDASQTFGYPEDVDRGPTISDLSLFFTSDPSKRLRHGKTFTGGEQQPLDTPCRVSGGQANCPLP